MGYKHEGDGILTLDGPICPDRVISISQDSLVAYVECQVRKCECCFGLQGNHFNFLNDQILKAIWEEVSINFKITWLEVLEFRETHLCSPKQSVQALNYRFHERQYQQHTRSYSQGTDPFSGSRYTSNSHPSSTLPTNHSFPPLHSHASVASIPVAPHCIYGTNGYYPNNYSTYATVAAPQHYPYHVPLSYVQPVVKPVYHPSNYIPNGYTVPPPPPPPYVCPAIPTAQLIEVESQSSHQYDVIDGPSHSRASKTRNSDLYNVKNDLKSSSSDKDDANSDALGSWDYVYRNLESQGYSKDLGERGDLLSPPLDTTKKNKIKEAKKVKSNGLEEAVNNLIINEKTQKFRERHNSDMVRPNEESEINLKKTVINKPLNGYIKTNTLPQEKTNFNVDYSLNNRPTNSKTLDVRKQNDKPKIRENELNVGTSNREGPHDSLKKWQCTTCTYLNDSLREICEMCGKSRVKVQDVMEIGGPQCPRCTLVNPKDNKICEACSGSLKDSPTYI